MGIRTREVNRFEAERESKLIGTVYGDLYVKIKYLEGRPVSIAPEYEDCSRIAKEHQIPLGEIMQQITIEAWGQIIAKGIPKGKEENDGEKN